MNELRTLHDVVVQWLAHGLLDASWWQIVLFTLVTTHITIVAVTVFLHRAQAHRALELGPVPSHFFRFWLWLSTGMVTKEWVAIHRKHHARCETADDPHSPVAHGLRTVLLRGSELYRAEAKVDETLRKYGHHTPDDWLERRVYSRYSWQGVGLLLILDLLLFGDRRIDRPLQLHLGQRRESDGGRGQPGIDAAQRVGVGHQRGALGERGRGGDVEGPGQEGGTHLRKPVGHGQPDPHLAHRPAVADGQGARDLRGCGIPVVTSPFGMLLLVAAPVGELGDDGELAGLDGVGGSVRGGHRVDQGGVVQAGELGRIDYRHFEHTVNITLKI